MRLRERFQAATCEIFGLRFETRPQRSHKLKLMVTSITPILEQNMPRAQARAGGRNTYSAFDFCAYCDPTPSAAPLTKQTPAQSEYTFTNCTGANLSNQQFSITAITTSTGGISERYAYTAYGQPTILDASGSSLSPQVSSLNNRYTYTGREWDATLGLYHFRARWMSPSAGRFIARDPIGYRNFSNIVRQFLESQERYIAKRSREHGNGEPFSRFGGSNRSNEEPQLLLHAYVSGRALSYVDPTGLDRYWIGGSHPGDHSSICVDEYDATGNKIGVYCCTIGAENGDNGCGGKGGGIIDTCNYCFSAVGISFYGIKIWCRSIPSVEVWADGQQVTTYRSSQSEDQVLLNRLKKENGTTWLFNGAMNNCHEHVGRRCPIGFKKSSKR